MQLPKGQSGEQRVPARHCCIITTVHTTFDTRIFHKQAKTLAAAGYRVSLVATHDREETVDGVNIVPLRRRSNRLARMLSMWTAYAVSRRLNADVYHFHDPELLPVGWLLRKRTGRPVIYDVHEHYPNAIMDKYWIPTWLRRTVRRAFEWMEQLLVPGITAVVYTTPIVGRRYLDLTSEAVPVDNLPSISFFGDLPEGPEFQDRTKVVYLGAMTKIRGLLELVRAFDIVRRRHESVRLHLIGGIVPDAFRAELAALIHELRLQEHVYLVGHIPYAEVQAHLAEARIGVVTFLPFSNNVSCLPNKLFEYMACGLPVVASDFPLYREVVEDAGFGVLVDPESPASVAEGIERLIADPTLCAEMSAKARKAFRERYNWESESRHLLGLYERIGSTCT